jgi:aminoglycoside phosphotransferase (APT) family kinase protein
VTDSTIAAGQPPAELAIDETLVRRLLAAQHPDLAELPLTYVADGWDNVTFRLGDDLAVRLPRRAVAVGLIASEQRWLPALAPSVGVAVPEPVGVGEPGEGFPWPWSVVRWVAGTPTDVEPLDASEAAAFGRFLAELHQSAPDDAPRNPHRGGPLRTKAEALAIRWDRLAHAELLRRWWAEVVDTPIDVDETWLHSDLHPKNVIGHDGRLAGVIDWGDLGVGDPATDLAAAWMHFPVDVHADLFDAYGGISEATFARARGWAVFFGTVFQDFEGAEQDTFARIGREVVDRLAGGAQ